MEMENQMATGGEVKAGAGLYDTHLQWPDLRGLTQMRGWLLAGGLESPAKKV
jgi:hypothetical protein